MTLSLAKYEVPKECSADGRWFSYEGKIRILLRPAGPMNVDFQAELHRQSKKYAREIRKNSLSPQKDRQLMSEVWGKTVLIGWEGIEETTPEGKTISVLYSTKKAQEFLIEYDSFYDTVKELSQSENFLNFDEEVVEESKKSSETD